MSRRDSLHYEVSHEEQDVGKLGTAIERWKRDKRTTMKGIVIDDVEELADEARRAADAGDTLTGPAYETSRANWTANAELLELAVEVLREAGRGDAQI